MSTGKIYFKNLDAIRFIAASMVFLGHGFSLPISFLPIKGSIFEKFLKAISNGEMGVSIFFVLSGFLITYLLINEHNLNGKVSVKKFYIRRVLRIWPLYYLVVIFSYVAYPFAKSLIGMSSPLGSNFLYSLVFLSNFDVINIQKYFFGDAAMSQTITWSVSIEEQFYLFWPLLFVLIPRKYWIYSILFVIVGSIVFRIVNFQDHVVLYFHTFSVLLDLGLGGLMAYLVLRFDGVKNFFNTCSTGMHLILFSISGFMIVFYENLFSFDYGYAVGRIFISISFALIITSQALTKKESILNLGNFTFASKWGKYTYGIYLIHPIAILVIDIVARLVHIPLTNFYSTFLVGVIAFILTLVLSKFSFLHYESRFLKLKSKFSA